MSAATATATAAVAGPPAACNQAEFARLQGWGKSYVTALKQDGRLVFDAAGLVLVQASLARIKATTGAPERAAAPVQGKAYSEAQDRERHYSAELKRLEYEREVRRLRSADEVASVAADAGAIVRTGIEAWRDRLPPQLAALGADEERIATFMAEECDHLLRRMAEKFGLLASTAEAAA